MSVPDPATTKWVPLWDTGAAGASPRGSIPGEIKMWSGSALPNQTKYGKWVWADGGIYSVATYPEAAANIDVAWKTAHGLADPGAGNFRAPDLRGVAPMGMDGMPGGSRANRTTRAIAIVLAGRSGEETHIVTVAEMPVHSHTVTDPQHNHGGATGSSGRIFAVNNDGGANSIANSTGGTATLPTLPINNGATGITIQNNGSGSAHENLPPTIFVPWIVRLDG